MTLAVSIALLIGVVMGLVPVWVWLAVCAVIGLRSARASWLQVWIACLTVELILPIRIGELSLPLLASVAVVAISRRFMADVGAFERRGMMVSGLVAVFCIIVSSLVSRAIGVAVYGGSFWFGLALTELVYAWLLVMAWYFGSSMLYMRSRS